MSSSPARRRRCSPSSPTESPAHTERGIFIGRWMCIPKSPPHWERSKATHSSRKSPTGRADAPTAAPQKLSRSMPTWPCGFPATAFSPKLSVRGFSKACSTAPHHPHRPQASGRGYTPATSVAPTNGKPSSPPKPSSNIAAPTPPCFSKAGARVGRSHKSAQNSSGSHAAIGANTSPKTKSAPHFSHATHSW